MEGYARAEGRAREICGEVCGEPPAGKQPKAGSRCRIKSGVNERRTNPRNTAGTEQSNKPLKERKKENGKDHIDVRDCVHIGTRGELLLQDDEGDREGVYAPSQSQEPRVKSQETCERSDGTAAEAV